MINAYLFKIIYSLVAAFPARVMVFLMRHLDEVPNEYFNKEFINGRDLS